MKNNGLIYTRFINRPLAKFIEPYICLHPNLITLLGLLLFLSGSYFLIKLNFITSYLLIVISYILDSCDGIAARKRGKVTLFGGWLDKTIDMLKVIVINLCYAYVLLFVTHNENINFLLLLSIILNLIFPILNFYAGQVRQSIFNSTNFKILSQYSTLKSRILWLLATPLDTGISYLMILILFLGENFFLTVYFLYGMGYFFVFFSHIYFSLKSNLY